VAADAAAPAMAREHAMIISSAHAQESQTPAAPATDAAPADQHGATDGQAVHTETGVPHDAPAHGVFPPFDPSTFASQLLWLAISFGLFYWFVKRVALPRIAGILEVRRDRISQDLDEANRLKEEADVAHAAYEQELAGARARAHAIATEAGDKAKTEADARRMKVEGELAARLGEAEARIATIRDKAMGEVGSIASDTAETIVRELIGASTATKAEIGRAVAAIRE